MTRHRITFEIPASEIDDFTRLGVCTPPVEFKIEPVRTEAHQALIDHGFASPTGLADFDFTPIPPRVR